MTHRCKHSSKVDPVIEIKRHVSNEVYFETGRDAVSCRLSFSNGVRLGSPI